MERRLKSNALRHYATSEYGGTSYPTTRRSDPKVLNLQQHAV